MWLLEGDRQVVFLRLFTVVGSIVAGLLIGLALYWFG